MNDQLVADGGEDLDGGGVDQSPWCVNCHRSIQKHDYPHKRIRFDGREKGSFCGRSCATSWLIRNDDRIDESFFDYEAVGGGPRLITDGGRDQLGDGMDQFCSLCYEQLPGDALSALIHVQREHFDSDEFRLFVHELVVRNFCAKCGTAFWSDVESLSKTTFGTRPYCRGCRRTNPPLKGLLTDHVTARGLLSRGLLRPELARKNRVIDTDIERSGGGS